MCEPKRFQHSIVKVPSGPLGMVIGTDFSGRTPIVTAWSKMPTGSIGPVERSNKVHVGDVLIRVDETEASEMHYKEVIEYLRNTSYKSRRLVFQPSNEYYRAKRLNLNISNFSFGQDSASRVAAAILDTRIVRENGKSKFCEYEVSVAAPCKHDLGNRMRRWSTWKRYSEFLELDSGLRKRYGWQLDSIKFPPKRTFNNLDESFIKERKEALDQYLNKILSIHGIADFEKHHCSPELKKFLEYIDDREKISLPLTNLETKCVDARARPALISPRRVSKTQFRKRESASS